MPFHFIYIKGIKMFKKLSNRFLQLSILASLLPAKAFAVLPAAGDVADGASTTSPIQMFRDFGSRGVTIAGTLIAGLIVLGIGYHIYSAFTEAREKREWGGFGVTASVGVVVAASTVIMAVLAIDYAAL